ncbi:DUF2789 family protein [Cupriavidus sp. 8B]
MDTPFHQLSDLFAQLGLPSNKTDIPAFVAKHSPLPQDINLWETPFWTPAQATLLHDEFDEGADWAQAVDPLNLALRAPA